MRAENPTIHKRVLDMSKTLLLLVIRVYLLLWPQNVFETHLNSYTFPDTSEPSESAISQQLVVSLPPSSVVVVRWNAYRARRLFVLTVALFFIYKYMSHRFRCGHWDYNYIDVNCKNVRQLVERELPEFCYLNRTARRVCIDHQPPPIHPPIRDRVFFTHETNYLKRYFDVVRTVVSVNYASSSMWWFCVSFDDFFVGRSVVVGQSWCWISMEEK